MNLKNVKYLDKFRRLPYPKNEMLIVGSGTMALLGLRENKDLDVWATPRIMKRVAQDKKFIAKKSEVDGSTLYESEDGKLEFASSFSFANLDLKTSLKKAIIIYGIHFQSPEEILAWKKKANRPKDRDDIIKLENYLKNNVVENYLNIIQLIS
jgi:hypothetical protein